MGESLELAGQLAGSDEERERWAKVWEEARASMFNLRGRHYLTDRKKYPSEEPLFETVLGDCVIAEGPLRHFASRVDIPKDLLDLRQRPLEQLHSNTRAQLLSRATSSRRMNCSPVPWP